MLLHVALSYCRLCLESFSYIDLFLTQMASECVRALNSDVTLTINSVVVIFVQSFTCYMPRHQSGAVSEAGVRLSIGGARAFAARCGSPFLPVTIVTPG